jgi:cation diffusion facilitator family transporter
MAFAPPPARNRSAPVRRVLLALLLANLTVVGAKAVVAVRANSLAILGAALDSAVDALNNGLAMLLVQVASKEPDEEHPYGHGKFETLGTLAIVGFLSVSCFELVRSAVNHLVSGGHPVAVTDFQLAVLVVTVGVNVLVAWYEQRRGAELGSQLLIADASHTRADVFVTVGVLVGVLLARQGWRWADPIAAIVVAAVIFRVAYGIVSRAIPVLVDQRALPPAEIQGTAEDVRGVRSAYRIRSRGTPPLRYAEVTISVDRDANVADAHAIADEVEERLKRDLQLHEVLVHVEPC